MFRSSVRHVLSAPLSSRPATASLLSRRFISTAPPHKKSRSWKSSAVRWGLAGALVYYYNTSSLFADEPAFTVHAPPEIEVEAEQETFPTIHEISAERQARKQAAAAPASTSEEHAPGPEDAVAGSPDELEEEASQQGAFNEETGEINWDCPCLGGMAHGPCGEQFREAFSCFVFSKEEPKGVDCIEKFKGMQDCFREHPDIYGSELEEDETAELIGEGGSGDVPAGAEDGVGAAVARDVPTKEAASPASKATPAAPTASVKESSE